MKEKLTALDIELVTSELDYKLNGLRLSNIYNIAESHRQFLLKFHKPDSRFNVVVTSGLKVHITDFTRPTPPQPSAFVAKLRTYLKSRRLTGVKQLDKDRVIVFQFSDGAYYLVLEFFSAGNVFLLDSTRRILVLQRIVEEHENVIGSTYNMFTEALFSGKSSDLDTSDAQFSEEKIKGWIDQEVVNFNTKKDVPAESTGKNKKKRVFSINKLLFLKAPYLSSPLIGKYLRDHNIDCNKSCMDFANDAALLKTVLSESLSEYKTLLNTPIDERVGYIVSKKNTLYKPDIDDESLEYIYETFEPFPPHLVNPDTEKVEVITNGYNSTIDRFFSSIESSKYALRIATHEHQAAKKIESTKLENDNRLKQFENIQSLNEQKGTSIMHYADAVENCKNAVQTLIDQQMDWEAIEKLIKMEQAKKNEIASMIKLPLDLINNKITVILPVVKYDTDNSDSDSSDEDEDEKDSKTKKETVSAVIDLSLSAFANSSNYFSIKKQTREKQSKTENNQKVALKNITERINKNLKSKLKEQHDVLKKIRTQYFFEKYFWFISSEGYLVLMGKSDQETDLIYSKYIDEQDVYVTNNIGGKFVQAFIKNPNKDKEIPPNTLMQAAIFSISGSEAWNKKLNSVGSWYCFCQNLSKFHPSDQAKKFPLEFGKFHILDESLKTNLPPVQMVMGLAFLWKVKADHDGIYVEEPVQNQLVSETSEPSVDVEPNEETIGSEEILSAVDMGDIQDEMQELKEEEIADEVNMLEKDVQSISLATDVVENMNKNVRGKKGKLKKIQRKYKEQDENERSMRLEILGTLKGVSKDQEKEQEQLMREQKRLDLQKLRKTRIEKQALKFTESTQPIVHYEKIFQDLKPVCNANDEILELVPMFAPWSSLNKYKFKVKIQPGNNKKLKSCSEILNYFSKNKVDPECKDKEMMWPRELELIKLVKDQELVPVFCVDKIKCNIPTDGKKKNGPSSSSKQKKNKK